MPVNPEQQINPTVCRNDAWFCSHSSVHLWTSSHLLLPCKWDIATDALYHSYHHVQLQRHQLVTSWWCETGEPHFAKDCCMFTVPWLVSIALNTILWQALSLESFCVPCPTYCCYVLLAYWRLPGFPRLQASKHANTVKKSQGFSERSTEFSWEDIKELHCSLCHAEPTNHLCHKKL